MSQRKLAIVTGASSGIGLEIAKLAAQDGFDLIVAADTPFVEAGPALEEYDVEVQQVEADLATKQGVDQLLQLVGDRQVDVLVANVGGAAGGTLMESTAEDWMRTFDMNLFHVFIWVGIFRFSLYAVKKCSFMKCKKNDFIFSGFWKVVVGHSKEFFDK